MRGYIIDEISKPDIIRIAEFLKKNAVSSNVENLFRIHIPEELLDRTQSGHKDCRPFRSSIEVGDDWVRAEFLIRGSGKFGCECDSYSSKEQRAFILNFMDRMIKELNIRT